MKPITVLIPTCERSETLKQALETCVCQNDDNFGILVSDNVSQDDTKEVIEDYRKRDSRISYINPGKRLGMSEHWNFALDHVTDGMLMIIGDDDGLLPQALPRLREEMELAPGAKAIHWPFSVYYYPDLPPLTGRHRLPNGHLGLSVKSGRELRDSRDWLSAAVNCLSAYSELPGAYHSLVDVSVIEELRNKTGRAISSISPDIYLAIALAALLDNYVHIYQPVSLLGVSKKSNGFSQIMVDEHKREQPRIHVRESQIKFNEKLAYLPNIVIFTVEAILQAEENGCLPSDLEINWKQFVELTHLELRETPFNDPEERQMRFDALKDISAAVGCTEFFQQLEREPRAYDWTGMRSTQYENVWDLTALDAGGIADACRIAQFFCDNRIYKGVDDEAQLSTTQSADEPVVDPVVDPILPATERQSAFRSGKLFRRVYDSLRYRASHGLRTLRSRVH